MKHTIGLDVTSIHIALAYIRSCESPLSNWMYNLPWILSLLKNMINLHATKANDGMCWYAGWLAIRRVGSDSQSTVIVSSIWFWSQTLRVQGISWKCGSRVQEPAGWPWAETGGKIGNPARFWPVNLSLLESKLVIIEVRLLGILYLPTGNLGRPLLERISGFDWGSN